MKNTNRKMNKKNKLAAMLAAVMVATTAASISASADNTTVSGSTVKASGTSVCAATADGGIKRRGGMLSHDNQNKGDVKPGEWRYDPETDTHGDYNYWQRKKIRQQYWKRFAYYDKVKGTKKKVSIENWGFFTAKNVKLYGRKCLGIDEYTGNWILGKWEQLNENTSFIAGRGIQFDIDGEYMCFAFSYDITWGTDFPFSRVFLDENCKYFATEWDKLQIQMWGAVRTACLDINLGDHAYLSETNCSSHSEWKP